jgi:DNA-binding winged helix-turn-helix (wHTH) protein
MRWEGSGVVFDSDTRQLLRDGQRVALSPKAFQLLHLLIEHRPKALSKSELHDRLWPNTFVVDANLANLIGEVRRGLNDDPIRSTFIRTVHRFGYAFCGESRQASAHEAACTVCHLFWPNGHVTLGEGEHIIGRDPQVSVFVDAPGVSRRHARIAIVAGGATLEDLGSKNGSSVSGRPAVGETTLADGDVITIGIVEMTVRLTLPLAPTETV